MAKANQETEEFLRARLEKELINLRSTYGGALTTAINETGVTGLQVAQVLDRVSEIKRAELEGRLAQDPIARLDEVLATSAVTKMDRRIARGMVDTSHRNLLVWTKTLGDTRDRLVQAGLPDDLHPVVYRPVPLAGFTRPTGITWGPGNEMLIALGGFSDVRGRIHTYRPSTKFVERALEALGVDQAYERAQQTFDTTLNVDPIPTNIPGIHLDLRHSFRKPGGRFAMPVERVIQLIAA